MVEFTTIRTGSELKAHGYKELGIYSMKDKKLQTLIVDATVNSKFDLLLSLLYEDFYKVYMKGGE